MSNGNRAQVFQNGGYIRKDNQFPFESAWRRIKLQHFPGTVRIGVILKGSQTGIIHKDIPITIQRDGKVPFRPFLFIWKMMKY